MKCASIKYLLLVLVLYGCLLKGYAQQDLKLWYNKPAEKWVEALPIGNGHIGAMVFGGIENELLQLNESALYSGGPIKKNINPEAPGYLPKIREALLEHADYSKANELAKKMQGLYTESYIPLGDIIINQNFKGKKPTAYYRALNINTAITTTRFTIEGVKYTREIFTSAPDNILVVRLTASRNGALTFDVSTNSQLKYLLSVTGKDELTVSGKAPAHVDPSYYNPKGREHIIYGDTTGCNGMRYEFRMKAVSKDGKIIVDSSAIHVKNATEVVIYIAAATSFNGFDKCPDSEGKDEKKIVNQLISNAVVKKYDLLKVAHLKDYQQFFNRVSFKITDSTGVNRNSKLPSDERLKAYSNGDYDPFIENLYFQYGRYLLISCSRPGGPPANLQGLWNKELRAPWSSNYTININTQMNYWPSEVTNLSELHQPLLDWIKNLSITGTNTAKEFYGLNGWVAHHNSEIWATSNAVGDKGAGDPVWANWNMGANWLCQDLWEHYCFTGDKKFLAEKAYPLMKGAAIFTLDYLVPDKDGYLVTAPSTSPENKFKDSTGKQQAISVASTMDMAIIYDLFTNLIDAANVLGTDTDFKNLLIQKRAKLYPMHIGSKGQLLEWYKDFEETDIHHRHASHLFGLFPGKQITPASGFFQAAKKSLEIRGDSGTGWSKSWKINWWARLQDGDHAYKLIRQLLSYVSTTTGSVLGGGTYPNFFDAHPPFQIDGNFAGTAGMAEMLLQSQSGEIVLLPALPKAWKDGEICGLKARGNFEVSMQWKNQQLTTATIKSVNGGECKLQTTFPVKISGVVTKSMFANNHYKTIFQTTKGDTYKLFVEH